MLNNKQKKHLRALGNTTKAVVQIGKDGLSPNLIESLDNALRAHELVKISILKSCEAPALELAYDLCAATKSELVQVIGRSILLYRLSEKKLIPLP